MQWGPVLQCGNVISYVRQQHPVWAPESHLSAAGPPLCWHSWESTGWWLRHIGSSLPGRRLQWSSTLLASAWPSPAGCDHLGSGLVNRRSLSLLSFQINKSLKMQSNSAWNHQICHGSKQLFYSKNYEYLSTNLENFTVIIITALINNDLLLHPTSDITGDKSQFKDQYGSKLSAEGIRVELEVQGHDLPLHFKWSFLIFFFSIEWLMLCDLQIKSFWNRERISDEKRRNNR